MTYTDGSFHDSDARAYTPGGLVGHNVQVDAEREHLRLKHLREIDATAQSNSSSNAVPRSRPLVDGAARPRPFPLAARGPVIWHGAAAVSHTATPAATTATATATVTRDRSPTERAPLYTSSYASNAVHPGPVTQHMRSHYETSAGQRVSPQPPLDTRVDASSSSTHSPPCAPATLALVSAPSIAPPLQSTSPLTESPSTEHTLTALQQRPLRRGKWTKAEELFAAATIRYFCAGLLNLQFGALLRGFLATQLHCHPMRISKKLLPGTTFCGVEISRKLGRRAYSPRWCDSHDATQQKRDAERHLTELRAAFIASLAAETDENDEISSSAVSRQLSHTTAAVATPTGSVSGQVPTVAVATTTTSELQQQQPVAGHKRSRDEWSDSALEQPHRRAPFASSPGFSNSLGQQHRQQPGASYYRREYAPAAASHYIRGHTHDRSQQHDQSSSCLSRSASYSIDSNVYARTSPSDASSSSWHRPGRSLVYAPTPVPSSQQSAFLHPNCHRSANDMAVRYSSPLERTQGASAPSYIQHQQQMHHMQIQRHKQMQTKTRQMQYDRESFGSSRESFGSSRESGSSTSGSVRQSPSASASAPLLPSLRASLHRASVAATTTTTSYAGVSRSSLLPNYEQQQSARR